MNQTNMIIAQTIHDLDRRAGHYVLTSIFNILENNITNNGSHFGKNVGSLLDNRPRLNSDDLQVV